ncbi:SF3a splicing factor complex subunit [Lobulomyces angularis]|nr:SF3a splicing factor complex subunit [Lobulomyces angularis]
MQKSGVKIRTDYVPKAKLLKKKKQTQICPRCELPIPVDEMDNHVRIELLDPKWREQKKRQQDKLKNSNLATNSLISENLRRLAEYRTDIFGGDEKQVEKKIIQEKKKALEKDSSIWDGHSETKKDLIQKVNLNSTLEELEKLKKAQSLIEANIEMENLKFKQKILEKGININVSSNPQTNGASNHLDPSENLTAAADSYSNVGYYNEAGIYVYNGVAYPPESLDPSIRHQYYPTGTISSDQLEQNNEYEKGVEDEFQSDQQPPTKKIKL